MDKKIGIGMAVIVFACSLSFYGGMQYGVSKNTPQIRGGMQGNFGGNFEEGQGPRLMDQSGQRGVRMGGGAAGEIIAKDDQSITVKLRDGGSMIVFLTASTPVTKSVDGSVGDLVVGEEVIVGGAKNDDGSVTATSIQIRPAAESSDKPASAE